MTISKEMNAGFWKSLQPSYRSPQEIERWFHEDERFGGSLDYYNFVRNVAEKITVIPCAADLEL